MESLFLLAFGEEEFLAALAMTGSEAFFNKLLDGLVELMVRQKPQDRPQSVSSVKEKLIAHGNEFVQMQQLEALKKQVIPESQVNDPILSDPIRAVEKEDYRNGTLTLRLNRPVNQKWEKCFKARATAFSSNVSSAMISFRGDKVFIQVNDRFVPQGVEFFKRYCEAANEEYAFQINGEHHHEIERRRAELRRQIAEEGARRKTLEKFEL